MNEYRITTGVTAGITITAIDESDARRIFKSHNKGVGTHDIAVTLIRENVCATKQQEREALEKIRAILASLGPHSYCYTAFEGCLEDAEHNIKDDAAYSMKSRYEEAQERLQHEITEHQATKKELGRARQALRDAESNVEYLGRKVEEAQSKAISDDDITDILQLIGSKVSEFQAEVENAAARIVEAATAPESAAFQNAVKDHQAAKADLEYYKALAARITPLGKQ